MEQPLLPHHPTWLEKLPDDYAEQDQAGESKEKGWWGEKQQQHNAQSQPAPPASGGMGRTGLRSGPGAAVGEVESRQRAPWGAQPQGLLELGDGQLKLMPGLSLWRTLV